MKRLILAMVLATAGGSGMGLPTQPALAASLCVGSGPGCSPTIQQALGVAHNGDTIRVGPGSYVGPISVLSSVRIFGAGAALTTIQGGGSGPVVMIGSSDLNTEPTVGITGLTVKGGINTSVPTPSQPRGGGVWVPPSATSGPGATVAMTDVIIIGNIVRASESGDCGPGCTSAFSRGGGIASFGTMTLTNTVVSNNQAILDLSPAPDNAAAHGGGIKNNGTLTVHNSTVSGNSVRFTTTSVNQTGESGEGGGIDTNGPLTMDNSTVSDNAVGVASTSTDPSSFTGDIGGGIYIHDTGSASIRGSMISGNSASATGYTGTNNGVGGGIGAGGPLVLLDSVVRNNSVVTSVTSPQPGSVNGSQGGGIEVDDVATIEDATLSGNGASATAPSGTVFVLGGGLNNTNGLTVTMSDTTITGNTALVTTSSGVAAL